MSLMHEGTDGKTRRFPAAVVHRFTDDRLAAEGLIYRLWACGYDMDKMKPRCWHESTLPLFHFPDQTRREAFAGTAAMLVTAAGLFLDNLRRALKDAWFSPNDPRRKSAKMDFVQDAFWQDTEQTFYRNLDLAAGAGDWESARAEVTRGWHAFLNRHTLDAFDRWVDYNAISEQSHPRRIAEAKRNLIRFNQGKKIKEVLDLPVKKAAA